MTVASDGPMLLAIDAGNTNLVFALVEEGVIRARSTILKCSPPNISASSR